MKTTRRAFLKKMNWALAGIIGMQGFVSCIEYGSPYTDYSVKGAVVNKVTKKPIQGIRVGYDCVLCARAMYGVPPTPYQPKSYVTTNAKGEFKLTERNWSGEPPSFVFVEDTDGEENGLFQSEILQISFKDAVHSGKPKSWYGGEYTLTLNVELTEKEKE